MFTKRQITHPDTTGADELRKDLRDGIVERIKELRKQHVEPMELSDLIDPEHIVHRYLVLIPEDYFKYVSDLEVLNDGAFFGYFTHNANEIHWCGALLTTGTKAMSDKIYVIGKDRFMEFYWLPTVKIRQLARPDLPNEWLPKTVIENVLLNPPVNMTTAKPDQTVRFHRLGDYTEISDKFPRKPPSGTIVFKRLGKEPLSGDNIKVLCKNTPVTCRFDPMGEPDVTYLTEIVLQIGGDHRGS